MRGRGARAAAAQRPRSCLCLSNEVAARKQHRNGRGLDRRRRFVADIRERGEQRLGQAKRAKGVQRTPGQGTTGTPIQRTCRTMAKTTYAARPRTIATRSFQRLAGADGIGRCTRLFFVMMRRPPSSTRLRTLCPDAPLFRSMECPHEDAHKCFNPSDGLSVFQTMCRIAGRSLTTGSIPRMG